ncbi:HNH endonuclease [Undibacterium flavidum]|uniref:HNH endonuclease n=1 Tax=Undibacterium flavidum TaxID=2762297 RepID=A0ABR6YD30_9BURK|nr:hypothetical protein [Undibacterium flavidum]MBC3874463.1 hypothetical protein [Undibacterium flavidum]
MALEHYVLNLCGDELTTCLHQLKALEEKPKGTVGIQVIDGRLMIERRVGKKNIATIELKASGHWPFSLTLKWTTFERLLLKEHAPMVKLQLFIDSSTGKSRFVADGMHLPPDQISTQLSLELLTDVPLRTLMTGGFSHESLMLERIHTLDAINAAMGITIKELLAKSYERDQELSKLIKLVRGEACQICGHYFLTLDGRKYVECHHLEHLANEGLDCSKNILVVCANHHRQLHYGLAKILSHTNESVVIEIDGVSHTCKL